MTTKAAENLYLAQHLYSMEGKRYALFNPHEKPLSELPVIYGFNNGGRPGWYDATLMAEDGEFLGGHLCSHEGYMPHDLGVLEGSSPDRHETFKQHYPEGYRMDFIGYADVDRHPGLKEAFKKNDAKKIEHELKLKDE
jgi:hypothetical protein